MRKTWRIALAVLGIVSCIGMGGCQADVMHAFGELINQPCPYHHYPDLYDEEQDCVIYTGNRYQKYDASGSGFRLLEEKMIVGRMTNIYGGCFPLYKSMHDTDVKVLEGRYSWYVQEGTTLPKNIFDCNFESITLRKAEKEIRIEDERFVFPVTIEDIAQEDETERKFSSDNVVARMDLMIEGYPYLSSNGIDLYAENDVIYVHGTVEQVYKYYKIKAEYQEIFQTALTMT